MPIIQAVDRAIRILEQFDDDECRVETDGNQARGLQLQKARFIGF